MNEIIEPVSHFRGEIQVPGDKSISHRLLILGSLAEGDTEITDLLESGDVQSTQRCLSHLGVEMRVEKQKTIVKGRGLSGLKPASSTLDCGNSGTTMRLLMGVLAGQSFTSSLTGDGSLVRRPMARVADPLLLMGAKVKLTDKNFAPVQICGGELRGIHYELPVASAQVKSALLLAGLFADGETEIGGKFQSRDHTERLLKCFGASLHTEKNGVVLQSGSRLSGISLRVPGDLSTAAFWISAAVLIEHSDLLLTGVSLNPSRTGFIEALKKMGVVIDVEVLKSGPEPEGDLHVKYGDMKGVEIESRHIPSLIDEIPLLAVLATQAHGATIIRGAEELRHKESDRLMATLNNLKAMDAKVEVLDDGFVVEGPQKLKGAHINPYGDHRIAMAFSIAGLIASGKTVIHDAEYVHISYPGFFNDLKRLTSE